MSQLFGRERKVFHSIPQEMSGLPTGNYNTRPFGHGNIYLSESPFTSICLKSML